MTPEALVNQWHYSTLNAYLDQYERELEELELETEFRARTLTAEVLAGKRLADFICWLDKNPLIEAQITRWMAGLHEQQWLPISRIYRQFINSPERDCLVDFLNENDAECMTVLRWLKACSEGNWAGIDGVYEQFFYWLMAD